MNQSTAVAAGDHFNASITVDGAQVHIAATNLGALLKTLGQFGYNDAALTPAPAPEVKPGKSKAAPAATVTAAASPAHAVSQPEAPGKPAAVAEPAPQSSDTPATPAATAEPASSPSPEAVRPTYDDVKAAVLGLAKISQQLAKDTLGKFLGQNGQPCDHGTKLKLEDYAAFLAAAAEAAK